MRYLSSCSKESVMFVECGHRVCQCCLRKMVTNAEQGAVVCPLDRILVDPNKVVED